APPGEIALQGRIFEPGAVEPRLLVARHGELLQVPGKGTPAMPLDALPDVRGGRPLLGGFEFRTRRRQGDGGNGRSGGRREEPLDGARRHPTREPLPPDAIPGLDLARVRHLLELSKSRGTVLLAVLRVVPVARHGVSRPIFSLGWRTFRARAP